MREIYISVDIETDGPIPGPNSMLQLGAAAFVETQSNPVGTIKYNLELLPGAGMHPETKREFWDKHPGLYEKTRVATLAPHDAMQRVQDWVQSVSEGYQAHPVFVGWPVAFDFAFTHWYFMNFLGADPFGYQGLDVRTFAMAAQRGGYRDELPNRWKSPTESLSHDALEDAIIQGSIFMEMLKENKGV